MLKAIEAQKLSLQGNQQAETEKRKQKQKKHREYLKEIRQFIPRRIELAGEAVQRAAGRGERQVQLSDPRLNALDCKEGTNLNKLKITDLWPPHQQFISHLSSAGYAVSFKYDMEPDRGDWCYILLKW